MATQQPKFGPEQYPSGSLIFRQGDPPEKFYIISKGRVEVIRQAEDGTEHVVNWLGPGDFFGEIGMLQWQRRLASVRALTDVYLMVMDRATFRSWMSSSAMTEAEISETMAQRIAQDAAVPDEALPRTGPLPPLPDETQDTAVSPTATPSTPHTDSGPVQFAAGDTIVHQGDIADTFYIIVNGRVEVVEELPDGSERPVAQLENGDYFGEIGLIEGNVRIATVRALTDVQAVSFNYHAFRRWLQKSPESETDILNTAHERLTQIQQAHDAVNDEP
ncbi:MAG: cyclic nucleotide-binding domain-containing protein [Anaerolineales bacterium]|nr:cyclic nucleotide-binding domain-containing protein [Anaerolineales bacterium]